MRIFKRWHILLFIFSALIVAGLFLLVAFKSSEADVQRWSLFSTMFFGLGSGCLSLIALWISIQTFVKTNKKEKEKTENEANQFIIDHSDEIDYLPLCIMANAYDRHRKYFRRIYTDFNKLKNNQQEEILNQLNYDCGLIKNNGWITRSKNRLDDFIKEYDFGDNFLFDFYEESLEFAANKYDTSNETLHVIPSIYLGAPKYKFEKEQCHDEGITFDKYLRQYIHAKINKDIRSSSAPKPLDILAGGDNLNEEDKKGICFWALSATDSIAKLFIEKPRKNNEIDRFPKTHAKIETFEDRFLLSLSILFDLDKIKDKQ